MDPVYMEPPPAHLMHVIGGSIASPVMGFLFANQSYNYTTTHFLVSAEPTIDRNQLGQLYANGSGHGFLNYNSYFVRGGVRGQFPMKDPDGVFLDINPIQFMPLLFPPYIPFFLPFGNDTYKFIPYWKFVENAEAADLEIYDGLFTDRYNPPQFGSYHFEKLNLTTEGAEIQYLIQFDNATGARESLVSTTPNRPTRFCQVAAAPFGSCTHLVSSAMLNYINNAFVTHLTGGKMQIQTNVQQMPYVIESPDFRIGDAIGNFFYPLILSFLLPVFMYTIVLEKAGKLREMMKLMGMKMYNYFIVTYITFYVFYLIIVVIFIILCLIFQFRFITQTNPLILFLTFIGWGFNLVSWAFLLSAFLNNTMIAVVVGYLLTIFGTTAGTILELFVFEKGNLLYKPILLVAPLPLSHVITSITSACNEMACPGVGALLRDREILFGIIFMFVNGILYLILGLYLDAVLPQAWGIRKHPLFCFEFLWNNKYTRKRKEKRHQAVLESNTEEFDSDVLEERKRVLSGEANPEKNPVYIKNLVKIYGREKLAVNDICLSLNQDECFGLLGPNGAGKTTTISMLCGLFSPTKGEAYVAGYSIINEIDKVHLSMGLCPQFDVLWGDLTCREHLYFYARLKGIKWSEQKKEVEEILEAVGLKQKGNTLSRSLSGGMKRRLSIGISLVGKPKIVMLDEPTTGLDPTSKRNLWNVILGAKKGKCIILTTHSLEEADVLCDRIGIVSRGQLKCIGTALHLKNKFGQGFRLSINFDESNREKAMACVQQILPEAKLHVEFAGNIQYEIPKQYVKVSKVFKEMEQNKEKFGIKDWALSQTSLEDVFLNIVRRDEEEEESRR